MRYAYNDGRPTVMPLVIDYSPPPPYEKQGNPGNSRKISIFSIPLVTLSLNAIGLWERMPRSGYAGSTAEGS